MAILLISSQTDDETKPERNLKKITSLHERVGKFNGLNIFFIETSGRSCLTARQACGVESAARANPQASITLFMEKTPIANLSRNKSDKDEVNCAITKFLLRRIENVRILRQNLLDHLEGTPLWEFYRNGLLNKSTTPLVHRSDAIRVALLWKNGGIYLDLDCIVMRPLDSLNNTVSTVRDFIPNWIENGVMAFSAGHPFLHFLMKSMILAFRPDNYLSLGPSAVTEAILDFCDRDDLPANTLLLCSRNSSLFIQPPDSFYAIGSGRADVLIPGVAGQFHPRLCTPSLPEITARLRTERVKVMAASDTTLFSDFRLNSLLQAQSFHPIDVTILRSLSILLVLKGSEMYTCLRNPMSQVRIVTCKNITTRQPKNVLVQSRGSLISGSGHNWDMSV